MTWRHLIIIVFWMTVLLLVAQTWYATFIDKPANRLVEQSRLINTPELPAAPETTAAALRVIDYQIVYNGSYLFDAVYKISNTGGRAARNIKFVLSPWKKIPTPDEGEAPPADAPYRSVSQEDHIPLLAPGASVERRLTFEATNCPEPPAILYEENRQITFDSD